MDMSHGEGGEQQDIPAVVNDLTNIKAALDQRDEIGNEIQMEDRAERKKSFMESMKNTKLEVGDITWKKVEIYDDIVKLSLFMLVNQAYFKKDKKDNCCKRLFIILLELMSVATLVV